MLELKFIASVAERDVDLVLVEEFTVNEEFRDWFSSRVYGMPVLDTALGAWHSVSDSEFGESDIVHMFNSLEGGQTALLIENKIDAPSQPKQGERYRRRGEKGVAAGYWDDFRTCVVAPARYLASSRHSEAYDCEISYEELLSFFLSRHRRDPRFLYKAQLIREGIDQNRRGYQPQISAEMTQFVKDYYACAAREYPKLRVFPAKPRPAGSTWVNFRPVGYPRDAILAHQLTAGKVKLLLANAASDYDQWQARFAQHLDSTMVVEIAGKSISLTVEVPPIDPIGRLFDDQQEAVRQALEAATRIDSTYKKVLEQ